MKVGRVVLWCRSCGVWFYAGTDAGQITTICPKCRHIVTTAKCIRCGYEWDMRGRTLPKRCASQDCRSPYYNRERIRER